MTPQIKIPKPLSRSVALLCILVAAGSMPVLAQPSAYKAIGQPMAVLPTDPLYMSWIDSVVVATSDRLMMTSRFRDHELTGFVPDTVFVRIDQDIDYIVSRPQSTSYFYTLHDRKGRIQLYTANLDGRKYKSRRIEFEGFEPEHPVFSDDGQIMIFSSLSTKRGMGGYDLWYSRFKDGEWQRPVNMGERINTPGDEVSPSVAGNILFFASNGHSESNGRHNLFASRLVSDEVKGDTIGVLQIGNCPVQRLPEPFNSRSADSRELLYNNTLNGGFFYSGGRFWGIEGPLFGTRYWGRVVDGRGEAVNQVQVQAVAGGHIQCSTVTDAQGFYSLTLPVGQSFRLCFFKPGHFSTRQEVTPRRNPSGDLLADERHDVEMDALPLGTPLRYADLFGPNASVELSAHGIEVLDVLVRFLNDNANLSATFLLSSDLVADAEFNSLLTARRLLSIEAYVRQRVPDTVELIFDNLCNGREGCADATGENRLTVVLRR